MTNSVHRARPITEAGRWALLWAEAEDRGRIIAEWLALVRQQQKRRTP